MVEVEVWSPRLVGAVVTIISMISLCKSLQRRKEIFHRLALGMGFHGFIFGICYMVGPAAIPKDDENAVGNAGTVATCSAQGFFNLRIIIDRDFLLCLGIFYLQLCWRIEQFR
mmetsp:Transcript_20047/g.30150  ORF Transcript_20047/g.30150 Transcript_20047/m.30150 type:complete len:113 (-) Transcript_20047:795-1133(-)